MMKTGYFGIPGTTGTKVHLVIDGKPACGWHPTAEHRFQWCSPGYRRDYVECRRCRKSGDKIVAAHESERK